MFGKSLIFIGVPLAILMGLTRKSRAATLPSSTAPKATLGNATNVKAPAAQIPAGWRRAKGSEVGSGGRALATTTLKAHHTEPFGSTFGPFDADGRTFMAMIEQHYHEPGGPVKPWGYHSGVTLLVPS